MKRFLLLVLFLSVAISRSQEFEEPGWIDVERAIDPGQIGGQGAAPVGQGTMALESQATAIAEATTPEIEALARGLEYDPVRIYNYVHDHIRLVLYFGSKKGAQLTLLERSGNDFDQCALLVALLRAAGYNPSYQFGILKMPYDNDDHTDLKHWLQLTLVNTNWATTSEFFSYFLGSRGYPVYFTNFADNNTIGFHRVWVKLPIDGTDYFLDPAFKISEPLLRTNLAGSMSLDTNTLWTAAAGTSTSDYAQSLNEAAVRGKLRDYTTNLLAWLQSNKPNASVDEIIGGWEIQPATNTTLPQTLRFQNYTDGGYTLLEWDNEPTNLMTRFTLSFEGTNYQWLIPSLQGQRLSLTFNSSGLAQLWQEDTLLIQKTTSGSGATTPVSAAFDYPFGWWDTANNKLVDTGFADTNPPRQTDYQRTNATYALIYAFDASPEFLRARNNHLDAYRAATNDSSREVVCETLNVMGLNWMEQTERVAQLLQKQSDVLWFVHHRFGRMAQEQYKGYYVDVYLQLSALRAASGNTSDDNLRKTKVFDLFSFFGSALEHAIIEQLQSANLVAASTVKMLQLANTNSQKIFLASSGNWTAGANVRSQLTNYNLSGLDSYINSGYTLLLPRDGAQNVAGPGTWKGYGLVARGTSSTTMLIAGNYNGGYVSDPTVTVDTPYVSQTAYTQPTYFTPTPTFTSTPYSLEPVRLSDGAYELTATDMSGGGPEPRGFAYTRYYNSSRRNHDLVGLGPGWVHSYYGRAVEVSAPEAGLGRTTPAQMAPMLVATEAAWQMYSTNLNPKNWLLTSLIAKWGIDQLINNAVSVSLGKDTLQFVRQPDSSYTPPANCTFTLGKTGSAYTLFQRHGNTFKFGGSYGYLTNILDQYNQPFTLTYTNGWVLSVKDWKNRTLTFYYGGSPLHCTCVWDGINQSVWLYYTGKTLTDVKDWENYHTYYTYDTDYQMIGVKNANGQVTVSNSYDGFGRVIEQYSQGDTNKTWRFYWSGYVNTEEDPTGARRRFFFDDKSRQIAQQDALGNTAWSYYDGQDHVVMTVSPLNEVTQFQFDGRHNMVRSIDSLGYTNIFNYDSQDRLTSTVDALGNQTTFGYNAKFQVTGTTNGAGDWVTLVYNATDGTLTSKTDPAGTTTYTYDTQGYLSGITYPNNLGTNGFLNNPYGDVLSHTDGRGCVTSFTYNHRRELTTNSAPTNVMVKITHDGVGNVQSTTDARSNTASNYWSPTGKLLGMVMPITPQGNPSTTNTYDSRDWLTRSIQNPSSAISATTLYTNDAAGRLISLADPILRTSRFGYDADGRKLASVNAASETNSQTWDARGSLLRSTDGAQHTVGRGYDAAGNQIRLTNRNGKVWQFYFDGANRLTNTVSPLGRSTKQIFNDRGLLKTVIEPSTETANLYYDARGRLTNRTDSVGTIYYGYDANNNQTSVIESGKTNSWTFDAYDRVSTYTDSEGNLIQYRRDANGNVTNLVYPGGKNVYYAFDSLNRLTNVTDWAARKTAIEYDLASRVKKITRPNGTVREMNYDTAGELTNIWEKTGAGVPISMFKLNWNNAARVEWEFAAPLPHASTPPTRTMTYDDDNRIATFNGNSVTYDSDGNLTYGPLTNNTLISYAYDARNRLVNAGGISYTYDPAGNRVALTNAGNVTKFVINPNAALSQVLMRVKNGVTNYYVYGLGLLYEADDAGSTKTYHFDFRGSTVTITDGSGNATDRFEYSSYGTVNYRSGSTDTPFLFNGCYGVQTDPNGLIYMRARYFNPYICRFSNPDPVGFSGGLNFYAYADGNPISLVDPFGLYGNPVSGPSGVVGPSSPFAPGGVAYVPNIQPPGPVTYLAGGLLVGAAGAAAVTFGAPLAVAALTTAGVSASTASAAVTGTMYLAGAFGGGLTVYDASKNAINGNWNAVAYDVGTFGGGALVGGLGGGRYIANNISPQPSTVPSSWNPFKDAGYNWVRNPDLPLSTDLYNVLGKGPTPSGGGQAATGISSGASLIWPPSGTQSSSVK